MLHGDYLGSVAAFFCMDLLLRYYYMLDNGAPKGSLAFLVRPLGIQVVVGKRLFLTHPIPSIL